MLTPEVGGAVGVAAGCSAAGAGGGMGEERPKPENAGTRRACALSTRSISSVGGWLCGAR
jgi:hypothetical protein